jgi:hypothetical protein
MLPRRPPHQLRGKGLFINSQTRPLHANEGNQATRKGRWCFSTRDPASIWDVTNQVGHMMHELVDACDPRHLRLKSFLGT